MYQKILLAFFSFITTYCQAQQSFNKEPFYKNANTKQNLIVQQFLARDSVNIVLDSFLFANEQKMDTLENYTFKDGFKRKDYKYMPFSTNNKKCVDLGFKISYDKKEKEYYTSGDHGQYVSVLNFKEKTSENIWVSHGWYPACDYAIWFGDTAVALLVVNSDQELEPKFQFEIVYFDLQKRIKRIYYCNKNIFITKSKFWDFYFVKKGMNKK
jgi:hypothetical protein